MALLVPKPGLVISYSYLWHYEHEKRIEEGRKDRPCLIILAVENEKNNTQVTVAPITHSKPLDPSIAVEIPLKVKQHLALDNVQSWVIVNEVNCFTWPGFDIRPIAGSQGRFDYGFLPPALFEKIKATLINHYRTSRLKHTSRD